MKRLLIDAGNTNIKLALVSDESWSRVHSFPTGCALDLGQFGDVDEAWVSNVAGEEVANCIVRASVDRGIPSRFIESRVTQCGVQNGYEKPELLGCDRWASMIAAWHLTKASCLVVNCGTATTIDALSGDGRFMGGLILPGIALMQRSLHSATALPELGEGKHENFPRNTRDAIYSGAIEATSGAIARQHARLDMKSRILLCGGAAFLLLPHLALQAEIVDNLVLKGLELIARDADRE